MMVQALIVERGRFVYTKEINLPDVYSNRSAIRYAKKMFPNAISITVTDSEPAQ